MFACSSTEKLLSKKWCILNIFIFNCEDTDEELREWKTKFDERIALLESKISKLEREMNDSEAKSSFLKQSITNYIMEISKLQADAEVIPLVLCSIWSREVLSHLASGS